MNWRHPGQHGAMRGKLGWRPQQWLRARRFRSQARGLNQMGQRLNQQAAMFQKTSGRKKRDLHETLKKM